MSQSKASILASNFNICMPFRILEGPGDIAIDVRSFEKLIIYYDTITIVTIITFIIIKVTIVITIVIFISLLY